MQKKETKKKQKHKKKTVGLKKKTICMDKRDAIENFFSVNKKMQQLTIFDFKFFIPLFGWSSKNHDFSILKLEKFSNKFDKNKKLIFP